MDSQIQCVIHGSFRKNWEGILEARNIFESAGIEVLAPSRSQITNIVDGFALFDGEEDRDPRLIEAEYLHKVINLGKNGFSYFYNPNGYIGKTASLEFGVAESKGINKFFLATPDDLPIYVPANAILSPSMLVRHIQENGQLPTPAIEDANIDLYQTINNLRKTNTATGGIIEYSYGGGRDKEILLVKTHQWGGRYSVVGERLLPNETLQSALFRGVMEETGLVVDYSLPLCTFDQFTGSGYFRSGIHLIFADVIAGVSSRKVRLNEEAQSYLWITASEALTTLDIEVNARNTIEIYKALTQIK